MADYFTRVSFAVTCTEAQAKILIDALNEYDAQALNDSDLDGDPPPVNSVIAKKLLTDFCDNFFSTGVDASWEATDGVWIRDDDGNACLELVANAVQYWLAEIGLEETVTFQWSNGCSKPRLDAYGGGACLITPTEQRWMDTTTWLHEQLRS